MIGDGGGRHIRYPASEKLEIIRLVEGLGHIGVRPTLAKLGIPKTTFYRRYDRLSGLRPGLVLPVDHPRRLFPLYHRLEALHHHEDRLRHRCKIGVAGSGFDLKVMHNSHRSIMVRPISPKT